MDEILLAMLEHQLPSVTGRVMYKVTEVEPGSHVSLMSAGRQQPSALRWADIARVFNEAGHGAEFTPTRVDEFLENPQNWDSSTMCALVLAMRDGSRVR
jgi:hypothetical protein